MSPGGGGGGGEFRLNFGTFGDGIYYNVANKLLRMWK